MKKAELLIALLLVCGIVVVVNLRDKIDLQALLGEASESAISSEMQSSEPVQEVMAGVDSSEENASSLPESQVESGLESSAAEESSEEDSSEGQEGQKGVEFLDDAVFIGDSRVQGLQLGTGLVNPRFLAERGMIVDQVENTNIFSLPSGGVGNAYQVLQEQSFGKAYIMFGVNELGWVDAEAFVEAYRDVVKRVKETQPGIPIYVQAILPVTASKSGDGDVYTNEKINAWNPMLQAMAAEEGCIWLDPGEAVRDENGALPEEAAVDGVHLTAEYCEKWLDYLLTHS